ncbi:MAG: hypothetical protein PWP65_2150 [Clostridia bacterium]|nr:hypothetical protein [Clostridia bacterium]
MELIRIGDKLIDRRKIASAIDRILELRRRGISQQEVARQLGLDRSFVSRLENLGEIRRGQRVAVIGFPVANKEELEEVLRQEGVEFSFLLTDAERWEYIRTKNGLELLNELMVLVARLRDYDNVILIGSDYRIKISEALLGKEVIGMEIGTSPIKGDRYVDPEKLRCLIREVMQKDGAKK